jgi:hypothetical protein
MPNGTSNYFSDCNKATKSSQVLGHLAGRCPSQLEPMLTPKVKPFFRLNFVDDVLAIGRMLKLVLCFYCSRKYLVFGFVKRLEKHQLSVVWASPRRAH